MRKLIINADDLGISLDVDAQIEECIRKGAVTSCTLMANAPAFEDGVRIAKQYPQISVGVHLNLIEFKPLTNADVFRKHGITDEGGNFIEGAIFVMPINEELKSAVFEEWDSQISKVKEAGINPTHCDSHQHTHTIQALQEPLVKVLKKHGIKKVRRKMIPSIRLMMREKNHPTVKLDKSKAVKVKKRNVLYRRFHLFSVIIANLWWNHKMKKCFDMADSFYAFRHFFYDSQVLNLGNTSSIIELMCHPGHIAFQDETAHLVKDKNWLHDGYTLISYKEI